MSYQPNSNYGGAPVAPNSTLAVVSLVTAILGFTFLPVIGSIVAVITGIMARREIRESNGMLSGDGLATAGLVLGWIGVAMTVLGLCIAGVIIGLPLCLIPLGLAVEGNNWLLPGLFMLLF